ncbi:hypothetical protein GV829_01655 [Sphingomonas lacunae]|uniref:DUF1097 domain-containing protein n=1 Tax=Sphingomonas lacunae TaxID=2698828 RepID=A0A6M4AQK1_9SPHN|nr:hypothetical protein [Sphingomonas lacunae]QJQ31305.1 hypothetical protein GV829_01655 [Sphingomonas lacunae]
MSEQKTEPQAAAEAPPGPVAGIVVTLIVVGLIVGWIIIGNMSFDPKGEAVFAGFLLLWFWANNEKLDVKRLPSATLGALYGIGLAWLLYALPTNYGSAGLVVALLAVIVSLYVQTCNFVPLVINASAMLFLTVAAAPLILTRVDWINMIIATLLGAVYFASVAEGVKWLAAKIGPKPPA